jgi:hypothetical protein
MKWRICLIFLIFFSMMSGPVDAENVTDDQMKGLDEQVQDVKKDVLSISAELNLLEEKLLFPSNTQISIFVSIEKGASVEPDAIKLQLDDKNVSDHIYSFKEVEALKRGGVQRIYTGNVVAGEHSMDVSVIGKMAGSKESETGSHSVTKGVGPQFVEISLTGTGIKFRDW